MASGYNSVVIGGGIIGLSCGYHLSLCGKKTLVVDRGEFGGGASGACDDMILLQSKKPGITLQFALESLEIYRSLGKELGRDLGFMQLGGMILIQNDNELEIVAGFAEEQRANGLDVTVIGKQEVARRQPHISDRFVASTYSPEDAQVDPFHVMQGFLDAGSRLGMEAVYHDGVTAIDQSATGGWCVTLASGRLIESETIVVAAGAWSGRIGDLLGVDIPISPKRGQLLITEKTPPVGQTNLWTASYMVTKLRPDLSDVPDDSDEAKLGLGFSFTRTTDGNYLVGSTREPATFDKRIRSQTAMRILSEQLVRNVPIMKHVHIIRHIAGLRPASVDGKMILGEWPRLPGVFVATGHEGDGIALAPITGRKLSDLVCGKPTTGDLVELSPERFCGKTTCKVPEV